MKTIEQQFKGLANQKKRLEAMESNEAYWKERENFEANLRAFLKEEFCSLPKEKFFQVCDMVSTYRPVPLHSFLISISQRQPIFGKRYEDNMRKAEEQVNIEEQIILGKNQ